ncbi:MAG: BolA/IbaG family iron-sulfur metabolism protein [Alphaproteobacteria bacterium]|jgi:BolA protein
MTVQATIEQKILSSLTPAHLEVINESYMHSVPPGSESHFKLVIVSDHFDGESRVKRQQSVNRILVDEFAAGLHALSMQTLTPDEWQARGGEVPDSPPCHGGGKAEV